MINLETFNKGVTTKPNKVLSTIDITNKVFKKLYPLKNTEGLDNLTFHVSNKNKIISQFKKGSDLEYFLKENLPEGNILYIDYIEVSPRRRDNGIGTKVVKQIIDRSKKIGLSGIYLDSYEESMDFWKSKGFMVDSDEQDEKDGEESDYHSAFYNFCDTNIEDTNASKIDLISVIKSNNYEYELKEKGINVLKDDLSLSN